MIIVIAICKAHACHEHVQFDLNIMGAEFVRLGGSNPLASLKVIDTCTEETATLCQLPGGRGGKFKLPTLSELHSFLFEEAFEEAHNATADVEATTRCFFELLRTHKIHPADFYDIEGVSNRLAAAYTAPVARIGLKHRNLKAASKKLKRQSEAKQPTAPVSPSDSSVLEAAVFAHLHTHSQFSVLQATSRISNLVASAAEAKMPALAP